MTLADGAWRGEKLLNLKQIADGAMAICDEKLVLSDAILSIADRFVSLLRLADCLTQCLHTVSTVIGSRGFTFAAPSINKLPLETRNSSSFVSFKRNLKTLLFLCLLLDLPRHLPPAPGDCLCFRFGLLTRKCWYFLLSSLSRVLTGVSK